MKIDDGKPGKYGKGFMKINSDDNLPLNKKIRFHNMTIIIKSVIEEDGKFYPQVFIRSVINART